MKTKPDMLRSEGNLNPTSRTRLSFDENSLSHLMKVLTDLYSDPALAVIREYSANAYDSHRSAGNPDPIRVFLPNPLSPTFVVKDQGIGLSVDELMNLFSKYGWSSKRGTDNEIGMLGVGCKSGLTYTSQFMVVAVKNGVKTSVLVTRENDGVGALQVMDTVATDEPAGVEVRIPVKDVNSFCLKARNFFRFWEEGTVLLDDEPPVRIGSDPSDLHLDPDVILCPRMTLPYDYIVMGNIPYPVEHSVSLVPNSTFRAVVRVPIGSVDFTPSREALHMTNATKDVLETARQYIKDAALYRAKKEVESSATHWEAWNTAKKWKKLVRGDFTYRGLPVPDQIRGMFLYWEVPNYEQRKFLPASRYTVLPSELSNLKFIVGHNVNSLTRQEKVRLVTHGIRGPIIIAEHEIGSPWLDAGITCIPWDSIPVLPRQPRKKVETQSLLAVGPVPYQVTAYIHPGENKTAPFPADITSVLESTEILSVPKPQVRQFLAENPHARPLREVVKERVNSYLDRLSPVELVITAQCAAKPVAPRIPDALKNAAKKGKIEDPALAEVCALGQPAATKLYATWSAVGRACIWLGIPAPTPPTQRFPLDDYPLVGTVGWAGENHLPEYVNALYRYRQPNQPNSEETK